MRDKAKDTTRTRNEERGKEKKKKQTYPRARRTKRSIGRADRSTRDDPTPPHRDERHHDASHAAKKKTTTTTTTTGSDRTVRRSVHETWEKNAQKRGARSIPQKERNERSVPCGAGLVTTKTMTLTNETNLASDVDGNGHETIETGTHRLERRRNEHEPKGSGHEKERRRRRNAQTRAWKRRSQNQWTRNGKKHGRHWVSKPEQTCSPSKDPDQWNEVRKTRKWIEQNDGRNPTPRMTRSG